MTTSVSVQRLELLVVFILLTGILGHAPINEARRSASGNHCAHVCRGAQSCILTSNGVRFLLRCVGLDGQEQIIPFKLPNITNLVDIETVVQTVLLPDGQTDGMHTQDVMRELMQLHELIKHSEILQPVVLEQQNVVHQQEVFQPKQTMQLPVISHENGLTQEIVPPSILLKHVVRRQASIYPTEMPPAQPNVAGTPEVRPANASSIRHSLSKALGELGRSPIRLNVNPSEIPMIVNFHRNRVRMTLQPAAPSTAAPTVNELSGNPQCEYCESPDQCQDRTRPYCFHSHACARRVCQSL